MAGPSVTLAVQIDASVLEDADLAAIMEVLSDAGLAPILDQIGEIMGQYEREDFATRGATFGRPWEPDAPSTVAQKLRHGFPADTMVRTGSAQEGMGEMIAVSGDSVEAGEDTYAMPYLMMHQPADLGGDNTGGGRLPARILVGFSGNEIEELRLTLLDAIQERTGISAGISVIVVEDGVTE